MSSLDRVLKSGPYLYALAIVALGFENIICSGAVDHKMGPEYSVLSLMPFLPPIAALSFAFGALSIACGAALVLPRAARGAAIVIGAVYFAAAVVLELPKYAAHLDDASLRTVFFEAATLGSFAWLAVDRARMPTALRYVGRFALAISLVVFGYDHFESLRFVAMLIPDWIPWHPFWVGFFGATFIAAGLSIGFGIIDRWAAALLGLQYALWVIVLHLPRTLGAYGIPRAIDDPGEWSSLFIAVAICGGAWAYARQLEMRPAPQHGAGDRESNT
jgi:uncharacterized membrane protein